MEKSRELLEFARKRRTYREFLSEDIDIEIIKNCILTAGTAPSGANKQPWHFCIVKNAEKKAELRKCCEEIEKTFYEEKISKEWADDLNKFKLSWQKPFLEQAPYLIVIFRENYKVMEDGTKDKNYYVPESANIAIGFLIHALYNAGLNSLTYTPAPVTFLRDLLGRPEGETPIMILAVGKGSPEYKLPTITKKSFEEIANII